MRIDFDRLILLLLIVRLRTVRIFSYLQALIKPIVSQYEDFNRYAELRRLRASATPQALMIEKLVYAETGVSISIVPVTDFASPDFEVVHPSDAPAEDVLSARSVVDRYKLAGVTYRIQGSVIPFTYDYADKVCARQQIESVDSYQYTDKVCAIKNVTKPICLVGVYLEEFGIARIVTNRPVESGLSLTVRFTWYDDQVSGGSDNQVVTLTILDQYTQGEPTQLKFGTNQNVSWALLSGPNPSSDDYYEYAYMN